MAGATHANLRDILLANRHAEASPLEDIGPRLPFGLVSSRPHMGMRMRLKASFNVSGYSAANQVILNALKKYGMIMTVSITVH